MLNKIDIHILGSGFSGLSAACYSSLQKNKVTVLEKNEQTGGRARVFTEKGYTFDMGPSWYWMPDIFENFFNDFGKNVSDYYTLVKLDPGFQIIYSDSDTLKIPSNLNDLKAIFESIEKGSADQLDKFLKEAKYKYEIGMNKLVFNPCLSWTEFLKLDVISGVIKSNIFKSFDKYVRSYFKDPRLISLMEFPVLFLGAKPQQTPALYSLMNHAELTQGTYYPMGGMHKIIAGMQKLAEELGVQFETNTNINKIEIVNNKVAQLHTTDKTIAVNKLIASSDYHHTESLMEEKYRNYNEKYWDSRVLAPSSLIFYLGVSKKLPKLIHHNLFFDKNFETHAFEIYDKPSWPSDPLFYVCCPSKTDDSVAPEGCENLFILMPLAPGINDSHEIREKYYQLIIKRIESYCNTPIKEHIAYKKSYCITDFKNDYNSYKGNAYGLANTLRQTAVLKPSMLNKNVSNLVYTGQLTVPGPGIPPAIISGKIAAQLINN
ncbi:MAG: phytoene desaturase [Sphingobacteriaceae bacterium]|nr:phytoene desaturase [Sphingobacteriaceae bacterium]